MDESLAEPEAQFFTNTRGGQFKLVIMGQVIAEKRNGVLIDVRVTQAAGTAERDAAIETLRQSRWAVRRRLGPITSTVLPSSSAWYAGVAPLLLWPTTSRAGAVRPLQP